MVPNIQISQDGFMAVERHVVMLVLLLAGYLIKEYIFNIFLKVSSNPLISTREDYISRFS